MEWTTHERESQAVFQTQDWRTEKQVVLLYLLSCPSLPRFYRSPLKHRKGEENNAPLFYAQLMCDSPSSRSPPVSWFPVEREGE